MAVINLVCIAMLLMRRKLSMFGKAELGGSEKLKFLCFFILFIVWILFLVFNLLTWRQSRRNKKKRKIYHTHKCTKKFQSTILPVSFWFVQFTICCYITIYTFIYSKFFCDCLLINPALWCGVNWKIQINKFKALVCVCVSVL